ncbi:plasmalemma vesicle-associated protein-like [Sinocyclocheilus anshuiensis]|uniref:plasmalemma vesicle-associated protein-like n=1 Tax=Sinocyclocheilus anshuiensis TaxID=1608454 RepID=UPI0007BA0D48|nr:PREDICTED: plasmalemma vesicle-associated protein-like [Sinocyclocheilus anshuiensis]
MYNSSYSQANFGLAAKKMHKSKGKSCGYYMKIVFFFSSLIQSLIIASLVLFLVYGQPEHTVEEKRLQELDQSVSKLTMENFILRGKEKNLTKVLNVTLTAKLKNDKALAELRRLANTSSVAIRSMQTTMSRCEMEKRMAAPRACPPTFCPDSSDNRRLQSMLQQSEEMLKLVKANFTQTVANVRTELDNSNKDKDGYHLETIRLRRDKAFLEDELALYQKKCKEDFVTSLRGIPDVTKEFLKRIDDLFSKHISFQLTCDKQKNQLEDIRENCSSLSREVENKLQSYLDIVGNQFTKINGENAKYVIDNIRLKEDATWCNQNRSAMIRESRRTLEQLQLKNDQDSEKLLLENRKLKDDNKLKGELISLREKEIKTLTNTVENLNTSLANCKPPMRTNPFMPNPFGLPNIPNTGGTGMSSTGLSKPNLPWTGAGSTGSAFPSPNGVGSSTRWGSTGTGVTGSLNTAVGGTGTLSGGLGSTGLGGPGSTRTGLAQTGTSSLGGVGPGLTGFGSAGSSSTATGQSGTGLTSFSSAGSSGVGMGKPAVGGAGVGSLGSNTPGFGTTLAGTRTPTGGTDVSQAQINLHLKELHRYSLPN